MKKILIIGVILTLFSSCFSDIANKEFTDQSFKTAISLIELHKVREGEYPESLDDLKFLGGWDGINLVEYRKLEDGYELNVTNGIFDDPVELSYPEEFWKGLGIKKTNVKRE